MTRVGREAPQGGEAALEARHHLIERRGESTELIALHRDGETAVQAAAVGDLADLRDHPIHWLERATRDPSSHEHRRHNADHESDHERREQLLQSQLGATRIGSREDRAELAAGVRHRAHHVMQRRAVGVEAIATQHVRSSPAPPAPTR